MKKLDDLDWKVALMVKMDEAIKANNMTLMEAFNVRLAPNASVLIKLK